MSRVGIRRKRTAKFCADEQESDTRPTRRVRCPYTLKPNTARSFQKLKEKLKQLTGRSNGMSIAGRKSAMNSVIRGWVNHFKLAKMKRIGRVRRLASSPHTDGDM
ncbi:MAG TPA: hypothetical protein GX720_02390 [Clostridiaceae bacterium]|nr:hypothetical protein [Clostridiaceae bacterium]